MKTFILAFASVLMFSTTAFAKHYACQCDVPGSEDGAPGLVNLTASSAAEAKRKAFRSRCGDQFSAREMSRPGVSISCEEVTQIQNHIPEESRRGGSDQ